jgi:hypothetical protein
LTDIANLPGLKNGQVPVPFSTKRKYASAGKTGLSMKASHLIIAMVSGISEPVIVKSVPGKIGPVEVPANEPLPLELAARATGMMIKRARRLQTEPAFIAAFDRAIETARQCAEPRNLMIAAQIRDDQLVAAKARLRAIEILRGPKPVAPAVSINMTQHNGAPAALPGYVIQLSPPDAAPEPKTIDGRVVPAAQCGNVGEVARDVLIERAEAAMRSPRDR